LPLRIRAGLPFCPKLFDSFLLARDLTFQLKDGSLAFVIFVKCQGGSPL
jgi:hypothetical protein